MRKQSLVLFLFLLIILFFVFPCGVWNPDAPTDQELINAFRQNEEEFEQLADLLESIYIYEPITLNQLPAKPINKIDSIRYFLKKNNLINARIYGRQGKCPCILLQQYTGILGRQKLEIYYMIKKNKCAPEPIVGNTEELIDVAKKIVKNDDRATLRKTINDKWDIFIRTE